MLFWCKDQENWPPMKAVRLGVLEMAQPNNLREKQNRKGFIILFKPQRSNNYKRQKKLLKIQKQQKQQKKKKNKM